MLGDWGRHLIKKRRLITETNIKKALPELDYQKICRDCYRHFGNNLLEFLLLPFHKTIFNKWLRFKNPEKFHKALEGGKGVILLTAHFGNWEILSCLSRFELKIYGLYQRLKHGDSAIRMLREYTGVQLIEKKSALKEGIKALRNNGILGMVADQGQGKKTYFFDLETCFPEGPARIALQTGASILPTFCIRRGNFLDIEILDEIIIPENISKEEAIDKITNEFAKILEKMIKQEPAQYFWMHDLWRLFKNDKTDL